MAFSRKEPLFLDHSDRGKLFPGKEVFPGAYLLQTQDTCTIYSFLQILFAYKYQLFTKKLLQFAASESDAKCVQPRGQRV